MARLLAVGTLITTIAVGAGGVAVGAGTVQQPGSFTRITTPSDPTYVTTTTAGTSGTEHFAVQGVTSADVTSVDLDCLWYDDTGAVVTPLATDVPVTDQSFAAEAAVTSLPSTCRLRAIPDGVDPTTGYLASFSGPVLYPEDTGVIQDSDKVTYAGLAAASQGDGLSITGDLAGCDAIADIATVALPDLRLQGPPLLMPNCLDTLEGVDVTTTGAGKASPIVVDHNNAYQPSAVHDVLITQDTLTLTQPKVTVSFHRSANHDVTMTESAPLMRCSVSNTVPATVATCPSLVGTGVSYTRVFDVTGGAHQVRTQDTFTSTDGKPHAVSLDVGSVVMSPPSGAIGFTFPGHSATFAPITHGQVIKGLGTRAGTVFVRSDLDAGATDSQATTFGISWSRAPSQIQAGAVNTGIGLGMQYALKVPAHGAATLAMAVSQATTTTAASALAKTAVASTISTPSISKPKPRAKIHGKKTTVTGSVANGGNGAVTAVTVNGHKAKLTAGAKATKFTVTFKESLGAHVLKVVATDSAGNTATATAKVRNIR